MIRKSRIYYVYCVIVINIKVVVGVDILISAVTFFNYMSTSIFTIFRPLGKEADKQDLLCDDDLLW